mmetsp:Transcript_12267/g.25918  ORF Transcript_12267/g.25918 Transcript_12267/m.25918 type:complete len:90 (-) Transcript_12267:786-1055(-)
MGDSPPPKKTKHGPGYIPEPYWRGTEEWSSDHTVSLAINNKLPITYALKLTGNPCSYQALKNVLTIIMKSMELNSLPSHTRVNKLMQLR